ncbi:MAG: DNA topology modulation protein [Oscillospiraceae bacterium]
MDLTSAKRIMVIGSSGSGKSTFSRQLSDRLKLPVIHLDKEYWRQNWVETPKEEWQSKQLEFVERDTWIIDGNYGGTMDIRIKRADTIIFLDINKWVCLYSAVKRWLTHIGKVRPDMGEGCKEKIDMEFILWIYHFPKKGRVRTINLIEQYKDKNCLILKTRKEVKQFWREYHD